MGRIISPNQGAFIEGRWIAENTIIAQEVTHKIKKHKGKSGLMMIKVDLNKAYDQLEWRCVEKALNAWGFFVEVQKLVRSCLCSVQYSLLINGGISGSYSPSHGMRQCNPLSPFLFILCSELLTRMLLRKEEKGCLHGIKVSCTVPSISHLMFANDLLVMSRAEKEYALAVKRSLDLFFRWSNQEANLNKSHILFSKNTGKEDRMAVKVYLGSKIWLKDRFILETLFWLAEIRAWISRL